MGTVVIAAAPSVARAEDAPGPGPDVAVHDPAPPRRWVTLEWNPLALLLQRVSANVEIAFAEHHAIVLDPYYFYPRTSAFPNPAGRDVLAQTFHGFGGEVGYRYYAGRGGLRGFFVGPSFFAARAKVTAGDGSSTSFDDVGIAADVGYQALVANGWVVSVGAGGQYTWTTQSIPDQQMPANVYANPGLQPRLLFALGYAF